MVDILRFLKLNSSMEVLTYIENILRIVIFTETSFVLFYGIKCMRMEIKRIKKLDKDIEEFETRLKK